VVQVDIEGPHPIEAGDTFLLCSDGLSNQVTDDEIGLVLSCLSPSEAVRALIDLACLRGGPDNITAIIVRALGPQVLQPGDSSPSASSVRPRSVRPVHPLIWTVLGVALLATVGLLALGQLLLAAVAGVIAGAVGTAALAQRYGGESQPEADDQHYGRGPYVTCDCTPTAGLLARLAELVRQLREATKEAPASVNLCPCDVLLAQAAAAVKSGKLAEAARCHLLAIMSMMAQLREQRIASSDSNVFM
jgi:PPM family protein phosphatase